MGHSAILGGEADRFTSHINFRYEHERQIFWRAVEDFDLRATAHRAS